MPPFAVSSAPGRFRRRRALRLASLALVVLLGAPPVVDAATLDALLRLPLEQLLQLRIDRAAAEPGPAPPPRPRDPGAGARP